MNLLLVSVLAWRIAALTLWLFLAVGAVDVVMHILRPQRHRLRTLK